MRAIALISGGLDSTLAAKLIQQQGIEIIGLHFQIPFGPCKTKEILFNLRIEIKNIDIKEGFLEIIKNPRYGFGSNMNPCIDCKIFMLQKAKEFMLQLKAKFVVTGEVLGQRPMSQNRQSLGLIEKKACLEGLLLRPLSAKLLSETIPEKNSWVKRQELLDFNGRSRKPQIALAKKLNIKYYAQPAGGCLLTDPQFAKKLKDLISYGKLNLDNIELLKIGRHFRISQEAKLVVGRDEKENEQLVNLAKEEDYLFMPSDELAGPTSLGRGLFSEDLIKLSCQITCRYCDLDGKAEAAIVYHKIGTVLNPQLLTSRDLSFAKRRTLRAFPLEEEKLISLRI